MMSSDKTRTLGEVTNMGYVWDLTKWFLGALLFLVVLDLLATDDIPQQHSDIYWGIWFVALVGAIATWFDRYRKNRRRRFIEDNQYEQAVEDSKRRQSAGTSDNEHDN